MHISQSHNVLPREARLYFAAAAAAAAKSLQSCPTLCNTIDGSPPGSPVPGILQARLYFKTWEKAVPPPHPSSNKSTSIDSLCWCTDLA